MSYYTDPSNQPYWSQTEQHYVVVDPATGQETEVADPNKSKTSWWAWGLIFVAVAAIIGFLIWYIIWSTRTDNTGATDAALSITGPQFSVLSETSIGATWSGVGDSNDVVTLFVNPTGQDMNFSKSGQPLGNYSQSLPISTPGTSASVGGLTPGATYDARLVVTNSKIPNESNAKPHQSGLTASSPSDRFTIQASGQKGQIRYHPAANSPSVVTYTLNNSNPNGSLFHHDTDGFICATNQIQPLTSTSLCEDGSFVLFSKPSITGLATTELGIIQKSQLSTTDQTTRAKWQFNNGDQKWCLIGTTNQCMTYDPNSTTIPLNITTNANGVPISLIPANGTTAGFVTTNGTTATGFVTTTNGTVVVAGAATTTNGFQPLITNQPVTVSTQGTRWANQPFLPPPI